MQLLHTVEEKKFKKMITYFEIEFIVCLDGFSFSLMDDGNYINLCYVAFICAIGFNEKTNYM